MSKNNVEPSIHNCVDILTLIFIENAFINANNIINKYKTMIYEKYKSNIPEKKIISQKNYFQVFLT